jgi:hypothetical protein
VDGAADAAEQACALGWRRTIMIVAASATTMGVRIAAHESAEGELRFQSAIMRFSLKKRKRLPCNRAAKELYALRLQPSAAAPSGASGYRTSTRTTVQD